MLLAALVLSAAIIAIGAFVVVREYAVPVFANGQVVAHGIDAEAGDLIAARFAGVPVGAARCPLILNLTGQRRGRCAIPIGATELRIDAAFDLEHRNIAFEHVDALFVTSDAERTIADQLAGEYGERFAVRCPGPAVRVVPPQTPVVCSIEAPDVMRRGVEVTPAGYAGEVRVEPLLGVATRAFRTFGSAIEQREGSIFIAGPALEQYVAADTALQSRGEVGRRGLVGGVRCPAHVALREGAHVSCTVRIAGESERYDVHFEKGVGLRIDADKTVEVVPALAEIARRYFERPRYTGGRPLHAKIECDSGTVAFVEPGTQLPCTATVGAKTIDFAFQITDADGDFTIVSSD